jgi:hypothetical protein
MDEPQTIAAGDIVSGLEPSELVEVRRVAPFGAKTLVEGITLQTKHEIKRPLSAQALAQLVKGRSQAHSFDGDAQVILLGAEAERIGIAHQFDLLFAVNSSVVDRGWVKWSSFSRSERSGVWGDLFTGRLQRYKHPRNILDFWHSLAAESPPKSIRRAGSPALMERKFRAGLWVRPARKLSKSTAGQWIPLAALQPVLA